MKTFSHCNQIFGSVTSHDLRLMCFAQENTLSLLSVFNEL